MLLGIGFEVSRPKSMPVTFFQLPVDPDVELLAISAAPCLHASMLPTTMTMH